MLENPFTLTFGQKPNEFIPRSEPMEVVRRSFDMQNPTSRIYMIAGVRGSGKTVSLAELSDYYSARQEWIVLNLSSDADLITQSISELARLSHENSVLPQTEVSASITFPVVGVQVKKADLHMDQDSVLRSNLELLQKEGRKVLFIIDEINNNAGVRHFCSEFQIYIRLHYPVYLLMAGLYDNISNLQNEKMLTFLYRAPKIFLDPLNLAAVTASYQSVFKISGREAVQMAKATKGYPFAFQILGYLRWETGKALEDLLPQYDSLLAQYVYEKIWMELSEKDQEIVKIIADGNYEVKQIRAKLEVSSQYFNVYRKRLIERGILYSPGHGALEFALPRFEKYVQMYWEDDQ